MDKAKILEQIGRVSALALRYERAAAMQNGQVAELEDIIRQVNATLHGTGLGSTLAQETQQDINRIKERAQHLQRLAAVCRARAAQLQTTLNQSGTDV